MTTPTTVTDDDIDDFLRSIYPAQAYTSRSSSSPSRRSRPFVTLTWAQSLDGKIAGAQGVQVRLSGDESMRLTHKLRALHASILVGSGTMLSDDPQLSARLPEMLPPDRQPKPIVLDSRLRTPVTAKLIKNYRAATMPQPCLLCSSNASSANRSALVEAGAAVQAVDSDSLTGRLKLDTLLTRHDVFGESLMVEGGASVIATFLQQQPSIVDLVIITVAPVWVGPEGISIGPQAELEHVASRTFGKDVVFVCRPRSGGS